MADDEALGDAERRMEVRLDGRLIQDLTIPADQAEVMKLVDLTPHLTAGVHRLSVTEKSGTAAAYQVTFRYHLQEALATAQNDPDYLHKLALQGASAGDQGPAPYAELIKTDAAKWHAIVTAAGIKLE